MKKFYLSLIVMATTLGASALTVSQPIKVNTDGPAHNPVLSPDGTTLLFSSDNHTGLKALSFATGRIKTLDSAPGAGFSPIFSTDGSAVVYQTAKLVDGLLNRDIRYYNLTTGETSQVAPMSRDEINLKKVAGHTDYVIANFDGITIAHNGATDIIRPIEDAHSYQWASLSPDGKMMVFVEPFKGVFVSNADGTDVIQIARKGDFPAWAGQNLITFTESHDDGYVILDSTLKVYDLTTGVTVSLTDASVKVGESTSSPNGQVVYSTLNGDVYLINVK